jgi:signal transduction histidine kinase
MYRITSDYGRPFEEKIQDLLQLGREHLDVETAFFTELTSDTQVIVAAKSENNDIQAGASCPLEESYCRRTINQDSALTVQHAGEDGWEDDAAYQRFGLETYIGSKVVLDGEISGTFCFADQEPRSRPFTDGEETFVELMAEWVSYELFQQQAKEQLRKQRDQLENFANALSHDLRNPLNVVHGFLELAEETGDPEHFQKCRDALGRMDGLIDNILALAREGDDVGETELIEIRNVITECWSFVVTGESTIRIDTDIVIAMDRSRGQQLFENLFRNAIDHGGNDVSLHVGDLSDKSGIYIEDDGPGVPEADRKRIFEDGYSTEENGTGFGLSIVKQIVDGHGWNITVTDSDSGGARFEITGIRTD